MYEVVDKHMKEIDSVTNTDKIYLPIKSATTKNFRKRHNIDARLMELQARIDLIKALRYMPIGHGKFDFAKM